MLRVVNRVNIVVDAKVSKEELPAPEVQVAPIEEKKVAAKKPAAKKTTKKVEDK